MKRSIFFTGIALLMLLLFVLNIPMPVYAASGDETTTGSLTLTPTIECIGVIASFTGDNNRNNSATLEYRQSGGSWQAGMTMYADRQGTLLINDVDTPNPLQNTWRASILGLTANTQYEVRVTFSDEDTVSGPNPITATATTRNDNPPSNGRTLYVATNGSDLNSGTDEDHPFRTIQMAANTVVAGDTVLVRAGTYSGNATISRSGAADNYITFRPYASEQVILDGNNSLSSLLAVVDANYIRIKGFTLTNTAYSEANAGALCLKTADNCILEDNTLVNCGGIGTILVRDGASRNLVQRNNIIFNQQYTQQPSAIYWWKAGSANVFRNNNITSDVYSGMWDGMGGGPENDLGYMYDSDFYNNTIVFSEEKNPLEDWDRDDGLQPEGGNVNIRIWGNRIENSNIGIASCPTMLGPAYIFRNVIINSHWGEFKLGDDSYGRIYIYHNTYYTTHVADGYKQTDYGVGNIVSRNNIVHAGRKVIEANTVRPDVNTFDFDYDNLYTAGEIFAEYYCPVTDGGASTLAQFQAIGIEVHGFSAADSKFLSVTGGDFRLQSGSPNLDKGEVLPGFNDASSPWPYQGSAPDLGAYEGEFANDPPPVGGGGGAVGGGGGGGAVATEDKTITSLMGIISENGTVWKDVEATSLDARLSLEIPLRTVARNTIGVFLSAVTITTINEPDPAGEYREIIGSAYKLGPPGATLDPPTNVSVKYNPSMLPSGVLEENLVIAFWDSSSGKWVDLESTVDPEADTVTTGISHFSTYAIMAHTSPASFEVAGLTITPTEINPGEDADISVLVRNVGDLAGSCNISLQIDDILVLTKHLVLAGMADSTVYFNVSPTAGEHKVSVNGLSGILTVKEPVPTSAAPPEPGTAMFSLSDLAINPDGVKSGESLSISVKVTNIGDSGGTYTPVLKLNGAEEARQEITLGVGQSKVVVFYLYMYVEGDYTVSIGDTLGQFTVSPLVQPASAVSEETTVQPRSSVRWWPWAVAIAVVVIAGGAGFLYYRRR